MNQYFVYIMASERNGTLYIGMTDDLNRRVYEHKHDTNDGFSKQYHVHTLVYYEACGDVYQAIVREKQLKKWNRKWKLRLIENFNPTWKDLSESYE
jgi:putative endonuclease